MGLLVRGLPKKKQSYKPCVVANSQGLVWFKILPMKSLTSSKSKWQNEASMVHQKSKEASLEQHIIQKAGAIIYLKNPTGLKEFKLTPHPLPPGIPKTNSKKYYQKDSKLLINYSSHT